MAMFVISRKTSGSYCFDFTSRRGTPLFSSMACKYKADCELIIDALQHGFDHFTITRQTTPAGKHFFRLSRNGLVIARSRYFNTPLRLEKGLEEVHRAITEAEVLDFSDNGDLFDMSEPVQLSA